MTFTKASLRPAETPGAFILDNDGDEQLLFAEDLVRLRALIDAALPREAHNHEATDPDAHVVFDSVCCGARLYRCEVISYATEDTVDVPSKPIISQGETVCRSCGHDLYPF